MKERLARAVSDLDEKAVAELVQECLAAGNDPPEILAACREGMIRVGRRYETGEYFVSDLIMAGEIFKQANTLLSAEILPGAASGSCAVIIGTVQGDIHDIGKNIVTSLLGANGYRVTDLGVNVPPGRFVAAVKKTGAVIVGLSGLLTTAYDAMKATVAALEESGLRTRVKVMIGGGTVTEQVCAYVGADAAGSDAQAAVNLCSRWSTGGESFDG